MNARVDIISRIEELLKDNVSVPIDIFQTHDLKKTTQKIYYQGESFKEFQKDIFSLLERVGYRVIPMDRAPFEAVSKDREKILLTCVHKYDKKLVKKAQFVTSVSKVTEKRAVVFTDKETGKTNIEGTPLIRKKELRKIRDPEEIFELIIERI
jgi:putative transcriptional regulator